MVGGPLCLLLGNFCFAKYLVRGLKTSQAYFPKQTEQQSHSCVTIPLISQFLSKHLRSLTSKCSPLLALNILHPWSINWLCTFLLPLLFPRRPPEFGCLDHSLRIPTFSLSHSYTYHSCWILTCMLVNNWRYTAQKVMILIQLML